tara:strand:+ start:1486 stop:1917 length:432 start_codon:yes stop_codon:yes gene_type:complete
MKKIGEFTVRGNMGTSTTAIGGDRAKIQLFDGRFDTAYKVKEFFVWALDTECHATLLTDENYNSPMMDASKNEQIAWATGTTSGNGPLPNGIVDPDNLIVEDLYIMGYATTQSQPWNYMIRLEKYDISEWQGALAVVKNASQG